VKSQHRTGEATVFRWWQFTNDMLKRSSFLSEGDFTKGHPIINIWKWRNNK